MPYQVKLEVFEGPFDLLLSLISRHKVNIYDVSLAQIAEEYLNYLEEMRQLDLEIASDFVLVAATLLEIKSAGLLPQPERVEDEETLSAFEQRQLLISRLIEYRKFKNAGAVLGARQKTEAQFFARRAGLEEQFDKLLPDFLADVELSQFKTLVEDLLDRERVRLIDSTHIANIKVSVEAKMDQILSLLARSRRVSFKEFSEGGSRAELVAAFLALLELYKRGRARVTQAKLFGDIEIKRSKVH